MAKNRISKHNFFHHYPLSIVALGILVLWIGLYSISSPSNHLGSFFGNRCRLDSGRRDRTCHQVHVRERVGGEPASAADCEPRLAALAGSLPDNLPAVDGKWLGGPLQGFGGEVRTGCRQHRLRVDADPWPAAADETSAGIALQGKRPMNRHRGPARSCAARHRSRIPGWLQARC